MTADPDTLDFPEGFPEVLDDADLDEIRSLAVEALAEVGKRTVQLRPHALVTEDGLQFFLTNLAHDCAATDRSQWPQLVNQYARAATVRSTLEETAISDEEFLTKLRARVFAPDPLANFAATHAYARPLIPDEPETSPIVVLCLDLPDTVITLADRHLIGRDVEAAWAAGIANTMAEPVDQHDQLHVTTQEDDTVFDEAELFVGESFYIASKVIDLPTLFSGRQVPHGVLFAVPDRHRVLVHVVTDTERAATALNLITALAQDWSAEAASPISPEVFYGKDGVYQQVTTRDAEGNVAVRVEGSFFDTLNELS